MLVDLIPANLRYSLHVNLIQHGRTICRSINPLCGQCDLRNFCADYRRQELARIESLDMPTAVDLFSGAGGLSEGFTRAGFRILLAIDQGPDSMKTYRLNHQQVPDDRMIVGDIRDIKAGSLRKLVGRKRIDVLVGAPRAYAPLFQGLRTTFPCVFEGFSRELSSHYIINTNCNALYSPIHYRKVANM